jgi:hypothetical protein
MILSWIIVLLKNIDGLWSSHSDHPIRNQIIQSSNHPMIFNNTLMDDTYGWLDIIHNIDGSFMEILH